MFGSVYLFIIVKEMVNITLRIIQDLKNNILSNYKGKIKV